MFEIPFQMCHLVQRVIAEEKKNLGGDKTDDYSVRGKMNTRAANTQQCVVFAP